ncbi:Methyltransferase type, partial [mine drainage metagenome]
KNIASNGIKNVQIIEKDICSSDLPGGFNKVFFSNVFHDLDCQDKLLDRLGRVAGLEITFIEFKPDTPFGPPRDIRFSSEALAGKLGKHGFDLIKEIEFEYHYAQKYRARTKLGGEMSAEIALKAVMISLHVEVPKVHDIRKVVRVYLAG